MTIFQPHAKQGTFSKGTVLLIALVAVTALLSIYLYNGVVDVRHGLDRAESSLRELSAANAELKNQLYGILDSRSLQDAAAELGLVKDNTPEYLETSWAFASQY